MDKQISGLLEIFAILPGWWIFPVAGLVAGVLAGCFGIGGGLVVVPVLAWVYVGMEVAEPVRMHLAIGTSLATAAACTLPVALAGSAGFILAGLSADGLPPFSSGYVYWPAVAGMAAASSFGAPLGAAIAHHAPTRGLRRALAILLMIVGLEMLLS
ncbi:MAG: sulfite exporter TauE/SafE family protein [Proteobacteria bacterium]|nr:sulfite exporter TauE/SafE family protein [Pseudomonadota bacterium]